MLQLSATRCSCIAILSYQSIELCRHSPLYCFSTRVFVVVVVVVVVDDFVMDSVRKFLYTSSYVFMAWYVVKNIHNFTFAFNS